MQKALPARTSREQAAQLSCGGEDGGALSQLGLGVPGAEDVVDAGEGGTLDDPLEEANGHDVRRLRGSGCAHGQHRPQHGHRRQPVVGRYDLQHEVVGNLPNDVAHGEERVDDRVLLALEVNVLLHARYIGILEVDPVQVVAPQQQTGKGEDEKVDLEQQLLLCLCRRALTPEHNTQSVQGRRHGRPV